MQIPASVPCGKAPVRLARQGANIVSTGADNQQRKVYAFIGYPQLPAEFFPYTIFSP